MSQSNSKQKSSKKSDKARRVNRIRNLVIGFVGLTTLAVIAYGMLYSTGVTEGGFTEGTHYNLIENPPPSRPGAPIKVKEFFSYGCVHCKNFDALIEDWQPSLPNGTEFERSPVSFSPAWGLLAQTYLALDELDALDGNHDRLFRAIHDNGKQFLSADQLADFAARGGVDKAQFLKTFNSSAIKRRMSTIETEMVKFGVRSVPTLIVADKYRVNLEVGRKVALNVVDHLLALERGVAQ